MSESQRSVYVLYGSQTGNSESIAKDLNDKLESVDGFESCCMALNEAAKLDLKEEALAVVIGNGDTPDNADKFWRTIKKRALAKDTFEGMPYTVLGLGDTNYDKFCFMGKSLDKRINELGGKRFFDLHCADEATGLEEVVEEWNDAVVGALQELLEIGGCNSPKE